MQSLGPVLVRYDILSLQELPMRFSFLTVDTESSIDVEDSGGTKPAALDASSTRARKVPFDELYGKSSAFEVAWKSYQSETTQIPDPVASAGLPLLGTQRPGLSVGQGRKSLVIVT